jgi:hypothetical protein
MRRAALLALISLAGLTGCATQWPSLPPTTYAGTVYNEPLQRPETNAQITAVRPGEKPGLVDHFWMAPASERDGTIGLTRSDANGSFVLTTRGGYATQLLVRSDDGDLTALRDRGLQHGSDKLWIGIQPELVAISYHSVDIDETEMKTFRSACTRIMFRFAATEEHHTSSLDGYHRNGVLSDAEYALLRQLGPHLLGPHPDIEPEWPRFRWRIKSFDEPIEFIAHGLENGRYDHLFPGPR